MASPHRHDGFYEPIGSVRQPGLQNQQSHQNLHRVQSRHLDNTFMPNNGLYTAEDHASRYDTGRYDTGRLGGSGYQYESSGAQTWNPNSYGGQTSFASISTTGRMKASRQRAALPQGWMDQAPPVPSINPLAALGNLSLGGPSPMRTETVNSDPTNEEDLIPTAIVIKNIPFAVKKEQLVQLMTDLNLPLPYAFNYHFDNGVFRGLAFANFTTPEETATVIDILNHFDLQGRKLRVEYKKMLPLAERERIEREKRERRGQLEEQHRPVPVASIQPPMISATSPASSMAMGRGQSKPDVDLNDPQTLQFYSQLLLFRDDLSREALIFPSTLSPQQRRIVHTLAHHMALAHVSRGTGEQRQVHVFRPPTNVSSMNTISSSVIPTTVHPVESSQQRRGLARAITMDFTEARSEGLYSTMGRGASSLLDVPTSPSGRPDLSRQNLRPAKSFADLRSFTPSPVPSSASFPAALGANLSRYAMEYGGNSVNSATPSLTPTATGNNAVSSSIQSESLLVNGLSSMSLTGSLGGNLHGMSSLRDARAQFLERQQQAQQQALQNERDYQAAQNQGRNAYGGLGQASYDDSPTRETRTGNVVPLRQPKGPESGSVGFGRNLHHANSRSNGENLDVQSGVEIVVE